MILNNRKFWLILGIIILFSSIGMTPSRSADQANFPDIYIDGSSAGDGSLASPYSNISDINWTTGGDNSIFDYLAGSPAASPTIHLAKDGEWREVMTAGASGTAAYPIIITSYGSGADPIINGAEDASEAGDWTEETGTGDLSNWSETDTASKLANTVAAARGGSGYGVAIVHDNTTTAAYLTDTFTATYTFHYIFYIKFADGGSWADGKYMFTSIKASGSDYQEVYIKRDGANMSLYSRLAGGDAMNYTAICASGNTDWHKIEFELKCDTSAGGYHVVEFDDVSKHNATGLTTNDRQADTLNLGGFSIQADITSPTVYIDDFISTDGTDTILEDDFEVPGASQWYTTIANQPQSVYRNATRMTEEATKVGVDAVTDWWWDAGNTRVYTYSAGAVNPVSNGGTNTFEIPQRLNCIVGSGTSSYITVDGLTMKYANGSAVATDTNHTNWVVQNNTISLCHGNGVKLLNAANHQVLDNTISYAGINDDADTTEIAGIFLSQSSGAIIDGNTVSYTGRAAVLLYGKSGGSYTVQNNEISYPGQNGSHGYGLQLYGESDGSGDTDGAIVRYNYIHDCGHQNISIHNRMINVEIYYNLLKDAGYFDGGDYQANISGNAADPSYVADGVEIYNNVMYQTSTAVHGRHNIRISTDSKWESCVIKNNIMYNGGTWGSDLTYCCNQTDHTVDPVLDYNCHYSAQADFLLIEGVSKTWATKAAGTEDNGINSDPLMTDPGAGDFTLQAASPCREAGTNVGLTADYNGDLVPQGATDIGAYEYPGGGAIFFGCNF